MKPTQQPIPASDIPPSIMELAYSSQQQVYRVQAVAKMAAEALSDFEADHHAKMCLEAIADMLSLVCNNLSQIVWALCDERAIIQAEEAQP